MLRIAMAVALALGVALSWSGAAVNAAPARADGLILSVDHPTAGDTLQAPGSLGGWAVDTMSMGDAGVASVAVYMDGDQNTGKLLGMADLGGSRPDVAAQFGPQFQNSGWNFNLYGEMVPAGSHSFTVVATSSVSGVSNAQSVAPVTVVGAPMAMQPPAPPTTGYAPATTQNQGNLQLSATLSNVSYLFGQNYYSALPTFNGYLYPGLALPNGTVIDTGTTIDDGQINYRGNFTPIGSFLAPAYANPNLYNGAYNYNTVLPGGVVAPYGANYGYWSGYNWGALNAAQPNQSELNSTDDTITFNPYGAGYRLGLQLPPAPSQIVGGVPALPPTGSFLAPGVPGYADPGTGQVINPGNGLVQTSSGQIIATGNPNGVVAAGNPNLSWQSYNFSGTSAMQATLVARVVMNGVPVQGAQVTYMGYQLPPTDANGMTSGNVMYPINPTNSIESTVTATYNGMTASMPLVLGWNQ